MICRADIPWTGYVPQLHPYTTKCKQHGLQIIPISSLEDSLNLLSTQAFPVIIAQDWFAEVGCIRLPSIVNIVDPTQVTAYFIEQVRTSQPNKETPILVVHRGLNNSTLMLYLQAGATALVDSTSTSPSQVRRVISQYLP